MVQTKLKMANLFLTMVMTPQIRTPQKINTKRKAGKKMLALTDVNGGTWKPCDCDNIGEQNMWHHDGVHMTHGELMNSPYLAPFMPTEIPG